MRVFIAEDAADVMTVVQELLRHVGGFEVVGTANGEFGATDWLLLHEGGCELAILDLVLQDGSGFHLIRRFKDHGAHVVVLSDYASMEIRRKARELGADAVYRKQEFGEFAQYIAHLRQQSPGPRSVADVSRRIDILEQIVVSELRVCLGIYGEDVLQHTAWAESAMTPEWAPYYIQAWLQGKRTAWRRLEVIRNELRTLCGDDDKRWSERLTRMEVLAGGELRDPEPTRPARL